MTDIILHCYYNYNIDNDTGIKVCTGKRVKAENGYVTPINYKYSTCTACRKSAEFNLALLSEL